MITQYSGLVRNQLVGNIGGMTEWKNSADAEKLLADMALMEEYAGLYDREVCPRLRELMRAKYERVVGVSPIDRIPFRLILTELSVTGHEAVADLVARTRRAIETDSSGRQVRQSPTTEF